MRRSLIILVFILLNSQLLMAVKISGYHTEYANKELDFYKYTDPVSLNMELVFKAKFDANGKFDSKVVIKEPTYVFADFGVYRGMFIIEPGLNTEILLPPFRAKSFADQKNPFFKPISFWLNTKNKPSLSNTIYNFENKFNLLTSKYFNQLYFRQSKEMYDTVLVAINKNFSGNTNPYFLHYKNLVIKSLETDVFRLEAENVWEQFNHLAPQYWNQPAFLELFDKTFDNKLSFESRGIQGKDLRKAVANHNINYLSDLLKSKYKLQGELQQITLIKLLHDAFYSGDFSKSDILALLNSTYLKDNKSLIIRESAKKVIAKLQHLQPGTKAPTICLKNLSGQKICTNETTEKYKYLIFADSEINVCKEHLKYLPEIEKKFGKYLDIYIVFRPTSKIELQRFLKEHNVPGTKLIDSDNRFIKEYGVKSFPQCYLLTAGHDVVFVDTRAPLNGFEQQFAPYLQNKLFERLRNQSR